MKLLWIFMGLLVLCLPGCGAPALSSALRANYSGDVKLEMKCEEYKQDVSRDVKYLNTIISKYYSEGWRLAAMSEYTSSGVTSFSTIVCFERPSK